MLRLPVRAADPGQRRRHAGRQPDIADKYRFTSFSIAFSIATGGTHTITFTGTSASDRTTFIDGVALASAGVTTTTALATSGTPSTLGANVTFTATVTGNAPTGNVAFKDGGKPFRLRCGGPARGSSAMRRVATCSTTSLSAGTHSIVATYAGDAANNGSTSATLAQVVNGGGGGGADVVWIDDSIPAGAIADGDEAWTWVASNPTPFSGTKAHRSPLRSGEHQHYFYNATTTLSVGVGDSLFAYVYLDPVTPPSEVMLQWYDGTSWNRAYWGANQIAWGTNGTASLRFIGALPPTASGCGYPCPLHRSAWKVTSSPAWPSPSTVAKPSGTAPENTAGHKQP